MNDRDDRHDTGELDLLEHELGDALRRCLAVVLDGERTPTRTDGAPGGAGATGIAPDDTPSGGRSVVELSGAPRQRVARRLVPAAAVLALVGGGALAWSGSSEPAVRPAQTGADVPATDGITDAITDATSTGETVPDPGGTQPVLPETSSPSVPVDLAGLVWIPTVEPDGFRLTSVAVTRAARVFDRPAERYLRRGADGSTVTAWVELAVAPVRPGDEAEGADTDDPTDDPTVHGQPADVFETNPGEWHVTWRESGLALRVRAGGLDRAAVLQLAESSVVDVRERAVRLAAPPDGFEATPAVAVAPDDAPTTSYSWLPEAATAGLFVVDAVARPNTGGHTLDTLQATSSVDGWEHTRIALDRGNADPLPAWVATSPSNEFGRLITITWIEGPYVLSVGGRVGLDQLREVAGGLVAASLPDVRALRTRVDAEALELPELDRATTPSEVVVSVRTTGTGANVVCVEAPFTRCRHTTSESSLVGGEQTAVVETFVVDGRTWVIGWAAGEHAPRLVADGVAQALPDVGRGALGTFFVARDPIPGASYVFDEGDLGTGPVFGSSTSLDEDLLV